MSHNLPTDFLFNRFIESKDKLRVYHGVDLIFSSQEDGITPLVSYLTDFGRYADGVYAFDRIVGNAAALLLYIAGCIEIWSQVGSELAIRTLDARGIRYHFVTVAPYIVNRKGDGMCPFEKLSLGKSAEEFYNLVQQ
jgi:hypothetical protein